MAVLATSYDVESGVKTTLKSTVSPTQTSNIKLNYALTITSGVLRFDPDTTREEFISFGGTIVSAGITTLTDVVRDLSLTANDFTGTGTGSQHSGGACIVELTNYHALYNQKANKDRANTFTAAQTLFGTNRLYFNNADQYIYSNGTELYFRSSTQPAIALATLASLSGVNDKAKVSVTDTIEGFLNTKMTVGEGLLKQITSPAADERLNIYLNTAVTATAQAFVAANLPAINELSAAGIANTTITNKQALSFNGNLRLDTADANEGSMNREWLFAGIAKNAGNAGDAVNFTTPGVVATVPAFTLAQRALCRLWSATPTNTTQNTATDNQDAATKWRAQLFTASAIVGEDNMAEVTLYLTKTGAPTGNATVKLYAVAAGVPTGASLGSATLAYSSITTGANVFSFSTPLAIVAGTQYAIVLDPGAGVSAGNCVAWNYQNTDVYAGGTSATSANSGSTWTAESTFDRYFSFRFRGIAGESVYLSDTDGTLDLVPGTYHTRIGRALSTTQVTLEPSAQSLYATLTGTFDPFAIGTSGSVNTDIVIGFRPRLVLAKIVVNTGSGLATATGTALAMLGEMAWNPASNLTATLLVRMTNDSPGVAAVTFAGAPTGIVVSSGSFANMSTSLTLSMSQLDSGQLRITRAFTKQASSVAITGNWSLFLYLIN